MFQIEKGVKELSSFVLYKNIPTFVIALSELGFSSKNFA